MADDSDLEAAIPIPFNVFFLLTVPGRVNSRRGHLSMSGNRKLLKASNQHGVCNHLQTTAQQTMLM